MDNAKRQSPRPSKVRIAFYVFLSILGVITTVVGGAFIYVWLQLEPTKTAEAKQIVIPNSASASQISDVLQEEGIIKNALIFKYYLKLEKEGGKFQAGTYSMNPGMDKADVIAMLNSGSTVKQETIRFTIPEGLTVLQIADKLAEEKLIDKDKFLELADKQQTWSNAEAVNEISADAKLHHRLEGYLFPETYEMKKGSTEQEILNRMISELDVKLAQLPKDWTIQLEKRKLTIHQLLTIASLVEREVVVDEERATVASVIYNRLNKPMKLQIDATVQYALDKPKERLYNKDLKVDSPYNTYLVDGLPPGPIAAPSLSSIKAALYPQDTEYFFYVTKKDGTGQHLFAKTFSEHNNNIANSNKTAQSK
ncbi:UPF0755 protein [Paenibacillus algorifonticola]|uniref:Endolytic murein transglycosylase n=1 Tax=Paenibacillus algorifonticola TaxID=684063 RepID=A0A1I2IN08_9BACL|nr:endolytic transglycosylase MltG [Paenibacillus algorifonticola]SFF42437.1 UPF0755 protein [Paenibacillus algorifonticola]